jgi:hypothetical protein
VGLRACRDQQLPEAHNIHLHSSPDTSATDTPRNVFFVPTCLLSTTSTFRPSSLYISCRQDIQATSTSHGCIETMSTMHSSNSGKVKRKQNRRTESSSSSSLSWTDQNNLLLGNLFPPTMKVEADTVQVVANTFQETNEQLLKDAAAQKLSSQQQPNKLSPVVATKDDFLVTRLSTVKRPPRCVDKR